MPRRFALIPAAGIGARMQAQYPKQYLPVAGKPMLLHVLHTFATSPDIDHTYVVVSADDGYISDLAAQLGEDASKVTILHNGGASRQESVLNGLDSIAAQAQPQDWILVHDAARPGLTHALIHTLVTTLADDPVGGLLAMPVVDTLKTSQDGQVTGTVPRNGMWSAQTPQMFRYQVLHDAMQAARAHLHMITDDASAIEMAGMQPKLVEGALRNFKLTHPQDVLLAEFLLNHTQG